MESNFINAGALWKRETGNKEKYLSGNVDIDGKRYSISIFAAKNKKSDKSPDYTISLNKAKTIPVPENNFVKKEDPAPF